MRYNGMSVCMGVGNKFKICDAQEFVGSGWGESPTSGPRGESLHARDNCSVRRDEH